MNVASIMLEKQQITSTRDMWGQRSEVMHEISELGEHFANCGVMNLVSYMLIYIVTAQPQPQPNSTSTRVGA